MVKRWSKIVLCLSVVVLLFGRPLIGSAFDPNLNRTHVISNSETEITDHLSSEITDKDDLVDAVVGIINYFLSFLAILCVIIIIYSGIQLVVSVGNEEKMKKMRKIITNMVIGLLLIAFSWALVNFVVTGINEGGSSSGGSSFSIAPPTAVVGTVVNFDATNITGESFDWDFGDSSTHGTGRTTMHIYNLPKKYTVELKVSLDGSSKTYRQTIQITSAAK